MHLIKSIQDAAFFVNNSGVVNWEWGGNASVEGFVDWVYDNYREIDLENYEYELIEYLGSVGENPKDYGL